MNVPEGGIDDLSALLEVERDLSDAELQALKQISQGHWEALRAAMVERARASYAFASPEQFATCVRAHLNAAQRLDLAHAEVYDCPHCAQRLKDRTQGP